MIDIERIGEICKALNEVGHVCNPRVVPIDKFDLTGFKIQVSDVPDFEVEYIKQTGPGMAGDDFEATVAYSFGEFMFVIDCNT
ncbi:hypothetical protein IWQ55_006397 [Labrenzia sp. EL_208]|nr:hypothetical protein [Labrenzia sp. EL_132]MBG6233162.1 hypothetical protein [Labrenzia sp. EL_208]